MNFFNFDLKKLVMIGIVLALPLISINMQQKPQESPWLTRPFTILGSAISEMFFSFSAGVKGTTALYVDLINIKKDSANLKTKNGELQAQLSKMDELLIENDRLRGLLAFKSQSKMSLIAAQVIGRDLVLDHNTITLNKGTNDGIKAGQAVITTEGALGYIFKPGPFTSHVMLITDRYAVIDAIVQRTRSHGIVEGKSQSSCSLKYVEKTEDVKEGDLVVTGGLDNIFPKGFPVAIVESVERKTFSVSLKVELRPVVDPYKAEEVFIVTNAANEDFSERFNPTPEAPAAEIPTTTTTAPEGTTTPNTNSTTTSETSPVAAPNKPKEEKKQ